MNKRRAIIFTIILAFTTAGFTVRVPPSPKWLTDPYIKASGGVGLNWIPVEGSERTNVMRSTTETGEKVEIASVTAGEYVDKNVTRGETYYYFLQAVTNAKSGWPSGVKSIHIPEAPRSPALSPPAWKSAEYKVVTEEIGKEYVTGYHVFLKWSGVGEALRYHVYRSSEKGKGYSLIGVHHGASFIDRIAGTGVTFHYRVTVVNDEAVETSLEQSPTKIVELPDPDNYLADKSKVAKYPPEFYMSYRQSSRPSGVARVPAIVDDDKNEQAKPDHAAPPSPDASSYSTVKEARQAPQKKQPSPQLLNLRNEDIPLSTRPRIKGHRSLSQLKKQRSRRGSSTGGTSPDPSYSAFGEVFDEVWVIAKLKKDVVPAEGEEWPGSGELRAVLSDKKQVAVPLEHTDVDASISGYVARVNVTQQYRNPYDTKIEAVYVFPLPQNSAVSDFVMTVGERRIRGVIREREEAARIYGEAKRQGYTASLLTQQRPNIFTQKVANIEPGRKIDIEITYFNTLSYSEGEYTFVFPMVVGPRYNPPGFTGGVGAVGRGSRGASGQKTEVQYLRPEERSGHDIMVTVDLDAGVGIEKVYSHSHAVEIEKARDSAARIRLRPADSIPNKDFVLRYRVAGKKVKSALMVDRDERGGYFTLMLQPPGNLEDLPRSGLEMVFVLDTSGSMNGWPITKVKAVMGRALKNLGADDTFQIVRFAGDATTFVPRPVPATVENIERALGWLEQLRSGGGTRMLEGIRASLDFPHDERRLRIVSFMTDGYIGNETRIFQAVSETLGPARIFSFGIGNSVNRYLIEGLARLGHGAVAYVLTGDSDTEAVDLFYRRIRHPALSDISIDWGDMEVTDIYPAHIPDLFVGRPVVVTGRFTGHGDTTLRIRGRCAGEHQAIALPVNLDDRQGRHPGISRLWARARIAELTDRSAAGGAGDRRDEILQTALAYNLMSAYTSFVAVDSTRRTAGDYGTTVNVPVPVPDGVKYDTTVRE